MGEFCALIELKMSGMLFVGLTIAYSLVGTIQCENQTLGYKQVSLNIIHEERVVDNSTLFQVKTRTIIYPPSGMVWNAICYFARNRTFVNIKIGIF